MLVSNQLPMLCTHLALGQCYVLCTQIRSVVDLLQTLGEPLVQDQLVV